MRRHVITLAATALLALALAPVAHAEFGFKPGSLDATFTAADGSPAMQAGSHPFEFTTIFEGNAISTPVGEIPDGDVKDVTVDLPPGLVASANPVPLCSTADFLQITDKHQLSSCSNSSAVGVAEPRISNGPFTGGAFPRSPVYMLVPPPGVAAKLGFVVLRVPVIIEATVNPNPPYNLEAHATNISQAVLFFGSKVTLWGTPADPAHDLERGECLESGKACPANLAQVPFFTMPRSCTGPLRTTFTADSWQEPNTLVSGFSESHDDSEPPSPLGVSGCGRLRFSPSITAKPTTIAAQSPTGLDFGLDVHDEGLIDPSGLAQSDIKKAVVTLPEGMTANPSLAEGLGVCSEEDLARESVDSAPGEGCPEASKIGTVEVETPLLEEPLKGSLFIAKPHANPFDSLLALYFVIKSPTLGIIIKQAALVEPNSVTGQLVTTVDNIPQLPFSHFTLHFRQGARSPLVSPPACGSYNASAELTPWSGGTPVTTTSVFQIVSGTNGGPCPVGGVPPFAPQVTTGTLNNAAGAYSQFDLRIARNDGEQELTRFSTIMPAGLTGNLSGIPFCSDAAIEAAKHVTGAQESSAPSCPAASEIGHTLVSAGVGPTLAQAPGRIYLAGPYNGAPLSIVSITSATVGPFDLGTVVVRFALRINPTTAQVEVDATGSDPIPHIIDGIVVHVREIHAYISREKFILNPTNCDPMSIANTISGAGADFTNPADQVPVTLTSPFQASDCSSLAFKPSFKVSTPGATSKAAGAGLSVKLTLPSTPAGSEANIRYVKVSLPKQLPSRLTTLQKACLAAVFDANPANCPSQSIVGHAKAITPILPVPLEGDAYFVSHGGEAFPSLILVLKGYGITIDLVGTTFISRAGITSSTFKTVPDEPVSSFELTLPQGEFSALAANLPPKDHGSFCGQKLVMPTTFIAQNGVEFDQSTPLSVSGCAPTRAQRLASALKACAKKRGKTRAGCERAARRKYGPVVKEKAKARKSK